MNDERHDEEPVEETSGIDDATAGMLNSLSDEVDGLQAALAESQARVTELEAERDAAPPLAAAPAGDDELRGLATTYRAAVRNGHPDAPKHLETLLSALGA